MEDPAHRSCDHNVPESVEGGGEAASEEHENNHDVDTCVSSLTSPVCFHAYPSVDQVDDMIGEEESTDVNTESTSSQDGESESSCAETAADNLHGTDVEQPPETPSETTGSSSSIAALEQNLQQKLLRPDDQMAETEACSPKLGRLVEGSRPTCKPGEEDPENPTESLLNQFREDIPPLPPPQLTRNTNVSVPGAFRCQSIEIPEEEEGNRSIEQAVPEETPSDNIDAATVQPGEIVAQPVESATSRQVAELVNEITSRPLERDNHRKLETWMLIVGFLALGGVLGVAFLIRHILSRRSNSNANSPPSTSPTVSPISALRGEVLNLFPRYTIDSLNDPNSAQSKALNWIMEDPYLPGYIDQAWRVRQRFALATFYFATGGPNWTRNDHWLDYSQHECTWYSADDFAFPVPWFTTYTSSHQNTCGQAKLRSDPSTFNHENQRYRNLWLWRNNLETTNGLPEELYWLTSLRSLSLFGGNFEGATLSTRIGQLRELEAVAYSWAGMSGSIPSQLGMLSNITFLAIGGNRFSGSLPSELGLLTDMETLLAYTNELSGNIPAELFQGFGRLAYIDLDQNRLTGPLPTSVGQLSSLEQGFFYQNNITGPLPSELGLLTSATRLALFMNHIDGSICTELAGISSLLTLELQDNLLSSSVPSELGAMPMLTHLFLQNNRLTGTLPVTLMSAVEGEPLIAFNASGNALSAKNELSVQSNGSLCWANFAFNETECSHKEGTVQFPVTCGCDCSC